MPPTKNFIERAAGILLHPTSLNTPYGIGDLGPSAYHFLHYINQTGFSYWQILPIGPTGYLDSPYQCISAFAGNPLLISPDELIKFGFISKDEVLHLLSNNNKENELVKWTRNSKIDYGNVREFKYGLLDKCFSYFLKEKVGKFFDLYLEFEKFCESEAYWLEDFVIYFSLKQKFGLKSWVDWPEEYRKRDENYINEWKSKNSEQLRFYRFIQWCFRWQWRNLQQYAESNNIKIIGDMPIFLAHDSVDVWKNQELFALNNDGTLKYQAGVPPDYFSETGQLWGNPLYNWDKMEKNQFKWFVQRISHLLKYMDWIRIDHFRGFEAYWQVDGEATNAINGKWIKAPGMKLFQEVKRLLGEIPIIAENLGIITKEVEELRNSFNFPGMAVVQFAFSDDATNVHLPHNYEKNTVGYSGTHDNNTTLGWWNNEATEAEKKYALEYIGGEGINIVQDMIRLLFQSVANLVIIPFQDYLGQNQDSRMNKPSKPEGNWIYRVPANALDEKKQSLFRDLLIIYGRMHKKIKR